MRILITGGAGFIGSHIADAYLAQGHEVAVLDNLSTGSRNNVAEGIRFYEADISDLSSLQKIVGSFQPEVVSHHAAQISVMESLQNPSYDASINIEGSLNVWQCARDCGSRKFIFSSSGGAIYGQVSSSPVSEQQSPNPLSPYGLSKHVFEQYLMLLNRFSAPEPVILRYANVYGPRQGAQGEAGVVSIFTRRLMEGKQCTIYGDGSMTRDYVFVKDVAQANCLALESGDRGIFNIGSGKETSTIELYQLLQELMPQESPPPIFSPEREGEVSSIALDYSHATASLNWQPQVNLTDGLQKVIDSLNPMWV